MRKRRIQRKKKVLNKASQKTKKIFPKLRGMKDILFDEYKYLDLVKRKSRELSRIYGFNRVSTPVLESLVMFEKALGKNSKIITGDMYTFVDKSGDKIALRSDATPSLARIYIEQKMNELAQPIKIFWLGPLFRSRTLQAGRYRQFEQFNLEVIGEASPVADFLLILVAYNFFKELQINVQIQINSLGCADCNEGYFEEIAKFYKGRGKRAKLCKECKKNLVKNPMALFGCKEEKCVEVRKDIPQIVDYLCEPCKNHFIKVLEYLDELDMPYNLNPYLVREFDYYNKTIFDIWAIDDGEEKSKDKFALGGGGRYDELIEKMGGEPTPACGFGIGLERTVAKIKEKNIPIKKRDDNVIFVAQLGEVARLKMFTLFEELRRGGFQVRQSFTKTSLKAQLEDAVAMGAKISLILGQKELMENTILIRDMESGIQEVIDYKKIRAELEKRLKKI